MHEAANLEVAVVPMAEVVVAVDIRHCCNHYCCYSPLHAVAAISVLDMP